MSAEETIGQDTTGSAEAPAGTVAALQVGQSAALERTFSAAEVRAFAELSGDLNPLHLDPAYAATTRFGAPIVQGLLSVAPITTLLGTRLPGNRPIYVSQTLRFLAPVYVGRTVVARVEVVGIRPDKPVVTLRTTVENPNGQVLLTGEAVVLLDAG